MKKKMIMLLLVGCMALSGCGKDKETSGDNASTDEKTENTESSEEAPGSDSEEAEKDTTPITDKTIEEEGIDYFMSLGNYKGIDLTRMSYEVTEEDIDNQIQTSLSAMPMELTDPETTVAVGDTVNIKYEGKIDGEVFDGGSADSYDLLIGSGTFIDDFEDQLVGWKKGETGEVNVTFPEDYTAEEYQGKDAVFTVTVNKISRTLEEPTEEWLEANTEYTTLEEYRAAIRAQLEENSEMTAKNTLWDDAWTAVEETARFNEYPQDLYDACMEQQKASYESYASMYGMGYDEFMEAMGITEDDLDASARSMVRNAMIMEYICIKEDMTEDSETYLNQMKELLTESNYESKEDALADGIPEFDIRFVTEYNCVMNFIIDNANISEENVTAEE